MVTKETSCTPLVCCFIEVEMTLFVFMEMLLKRSEKGEVSTRLIFQPVSTFRMQGFLACKNPPPSPHPYTAVGFNGQAYCGPLGVC